MKHSTYNSGTEYGLKFTTFWYCRARRSVNFVISVWNGRKIILKLPAYETNTKYLVEEPKAAQSGRIIGGTI